MCIQTKCSHYLWVLLVAGCFLAPLSSSYAQEEIDVLAAGDLMGGMPDNPALQAEIDKILGMSESKIKAGIVDPGVDVASLAINKAIDKIVKKIADAVVVAPAAEQIMSAYEKLKAKKLVKKLTSLRQVWKDGQERLNKLNYQDYKLRYEWAMQHNQENEAIAGSKIKGIESQLTKDIWGTQIGAIGQTYDNGGPTSKLVERYLNKGTDDMAFYNLSLILGTLGSTDLIKARNKFALSKGKPVFLSPYERLKLQQKSLSEAKEHHEDLVNFGRGVAASVNYYRLAESEYNQRVMLSKTISDPYMAKFKQKK